MLHTSCSPARPPDPVRAEHETNGRAMTLTQTTTEPGAESASTAVRTARDALSALDRRNPGSSARLRLEFLDARDRFQAGELDAAALIAAAERIRSLAVAA